MAAKSAAKKTKKPQVKKVKAKSVKKAVGKSTSKSKTKKAAVKSKSAAVKKTAPKKVKVIKSKKSPGKEKLSKVTAKKKAAKTGKVTVKKKTTAKVSAPKTHVKEVHKPEPVKRVIKGYSAKDLEHFRSIILEKRDEIIEQLQNLKEQMLDPTTGEYINENSPYSLHMAEQGTDAMEREKIFLYAQRENKFLGYLEDALKRIDSGTYGICIECIDEPQYLCETCPLIPKARLEAVPHSQLCLQIKQKQEKK